MQNALLDILKGLRDDFPKITTVLTLIGFIMILRRVLKLIGSLYRVFFRRRRNLKKRYGENTWAFVTGSSDGIGKQLALQLARQGFNVIISARTKQKLQKVRQQILQQYPTVSVKILPADYKKCVDITYMENIFKEISDLNISILINNVGADVLQYYHKLNIEVINDLVKLNCFPVTLLNRLFIPKFIKRLQQQKLKSAIVNISSMAAQFPLALHNVYTASKAYSDKLSRALSYEYPQIDIMSVRPSQVSTPMTYHKQIDILTISAKVCAIGILNDLGYDTQTNGYWTHKFQSWLYEVIGERIFMYFWLNYVGPDFIKQRQKNKKKN